MEEAKQNKAGLCTKCRIHGEKNSYSNGHNRLCPRRYCPCSNCKSYDEARDKLNNINAHVKNLEGQCKTDVKINPEMKVEVEFKVKEEQLELKEEPGEYFSGDEEINDDARPVSLNIEDFVINEDVSESRNTKINDKIDGRTPPPVIEEKLDDVCAYCDKLIGQLLGEHLQVCETARVFFAEENNENTEGVIKSSSFEVTIEDVADCSDENEIFDLDEVRSTKCPICSSDFSHSSSEELQVHAETCQDFFTRACFMCHEVFASTESPGKFEKHVQDHFNEEGDLNNIEDSGTIDQPNNVAASNPVSNNKRKAENEVCNSTKKIQGGVDSILQIPTLKVESSKFPKLKMEPKEVAIKVEKEAIQDDHKTTIKLNKTVNAPQCRIKDAMNKFNGQCSQPGVKIITVEAGKIGLIIGANGWFKKKVLADTGVTISVEEHKNTTGPVNVTLIGSSLNVTTALGMIEMKLGMKYKRWF